MKHRIALAADTASITVMELLDNAVPGAALRAGDRIRSNNACNGTGPSR